MINYGCNGMVAVISGGTSGIGLETARLLLLDGVHVFLLGRNAERGARALQYLEKEMAPYNHKHTFAMGGGTEASGCHEVDAHFVQTDVTNQESCKKAMEKISEIVGQPDFALNILVNCAGIYEEQRLENVTETDYASIMDTNVKGTMWLTQVAMSYLAQGASVINVASDAGVKGNYGCPVYCASKGAVVAFTRALALDLAYKKVRVNCICPGDVKTPLLDRQLEQANGGYTIEEVAAAYPLGRIATPNEIAHVICSVASPANSFMTGSIISVDGGLTA